MAVVNLRIDMQTKDLFMSSVEFPEEFVPKARFRLSEPEDASSRWQILVQVEETGPDEEPMLVWRAHTVQLVVVNLNRSQIFRLDGRALSALAYLRILGDGSYDVGVYGGDGDGVESEVGSDSDFNEGGKDAP